MQGTARAAIPRRSRARILAAALAATLVAVWSATPAFADPPPWAPAHGYRAKHKYKHHSHPYYTKERRYISPIGVGLGRCNREQVGMLLGGTAGAVAGSTIGKGDGRTAAVIGGAIVGLLAGGAIGRSLDNADGYCIAQALAYVDDGETVIWRNPDAHTRYNVTPTRSFANEAGRYCREYTALATIGDRHEQVHGTACLQPDGSWQLVS